MYPTVSLARLTPGAATWVFVVPGTWISVPISPSKGIEDLYLTGVAGCRSSVKTFLILAAGVKQGVGTYLLHKCVTLPSTRHNMRMLA